MENEVDLSSGNPLDLTPKGPLAGENLALPSGPDLSSTPNLGPGSSKLYPGLGAGAMGSNRTMYPAQSGNSLDDAEKILKAKRDRMQIGLTGPMSGLLQFLAPDAVKEIGDEAAKTDLQIQDIQQKRQTQADMQAAARNRGLTRSLGPNATEATLNEESLREWKEDGNYDAYKALHGAGQGARADLYMSEGINALGKQTEAGQRAVDRLNSATTQAEYNSVRNDVLNKSKDGSHEFSAGSLGLNENNIPKFQMDWVKKRGAATAKLNEAAATVENFNQKQNQLSQAVPITDEKVASAVTGALQMSNGESFPNIKAVSMPGAGGAQGGLMQPGSKDIAKFGVEGGWSNATPAQVETINKQVDAEQVKGAVGRYKIAKDFATYANDDRMYTYSAGLAALNDKFGGVERNIAEGSKGSGNIGLTKQLERQYGIPEHLANEVMKARSELRSYFDNGAKGPLPKLSPQSIEGMKYIANVGLNNTKGEFDRVAQPVETAGRYGVQLSKLGLDTEMQNDPLLKDVHTKALAQARLDIDKYPAIIKGDRRVALPEDAKVSGMIPAGSYASTLPKVPASGTSNVLPLVNPAASVPPSASGGVSPPPVGITQDYLVKTAKVESGGKWDAGNNVTSASGAFQFTNATWNQFKPEGAPNRAANATPQQQTEAARALTESNAKVLARNDIPVNDTNAYIAHNIGASGAVKFMQARDDAKARAVVGEEAAKNNPLFFKGDPTVGEAKARYAQVMQGIAQPTAEQIATYNATRENAAAVKAKMAASATTNAANIAPALGAVAGMPLGPAGTIAGGAAGGAVRQYFNGGAGYTDQMVRGALEAVPAAIPGVRPLATAARVVAGGAVPAAEKLYDTGGQDVGGAIEAGAVGAAGGAGGELIGAGAGILGHSIWSRLSKAGQTEMTAAAKTVATVEPKIANAAGKMVDNPEYVKAVDALKSIGKSPEQAAHDYRSWEAGQTERQAVGQRPVEVAKANAIKEMNAVRDEATATNNSFVNDLAKGNKPPLTEGPLSKIRTEENLTGKVPEEFKPDAIHAERLMRASADDWNKSWHNMGVARSELLEKERIALRDGKTDEAKAMRVLADSVRDYQEKIAVAMHGSEKAKPLMDRLSKADNAYREAMNASGDGDVVKAIAAGGNKGAEVQRAYNKLIGDDVQAKRLVDKLVAIEKASAGGPLTRTMVAVGAALHGMPQVTAMIGYNELRKVLDKHMTIKAAGGVVKLETLLRREIASKAYARRAGSVIGSSVGNQMMQ